MDIGASYKITWAMFFCNLAILLHHANLKTILMVTVIQLLYMLWTFSLSLPSLQ